MRWKYIFLFILFVSCAVLAALGGLRWQEARAAEETQQEIAICKNQYQMGKHDRVQANLTRILQENTALAEADSLWAMLAHSYEATDNEAEAQEAWAKIRTDFPGSEHHPEAMAALARSLTDQGRDDEALEQWDLIASSYPNSPFATRGKVEKARAVYREGDLPAAKGLLIDVLEASPSEDIERQAEDLLGEINMEMLPLRADEIYVIARGDNLEKIGKRFDVSPELLCRVNHIRDPRNLRVGRRLKIPHTDFSMVVDKSDNTMVLYDGGEFFKRYRVRTGKEDYMTPVGEFTIESKVVDPSWSDPLTGRRFAPGHPENELGTRWMAFQGSIGLHGTIHPETIGKYASNGCVGLLTEDVEELFDLVPLGAPIKIVGKMERGSRSAE